MSAIQTLAAYEAGTTTANRLIAAWAGRFWDVRLDWSDVATRNTLIAHPSGEAELFGSDRWSSAQITNSAGQVFRVFANGVDSPVRFTGHRLDDARCRIAPDYIELVGEGNEPDFSADRLRGVVTFKNRIWWHERPGRNSGTAPCSHRAATSIRSTSAPQQVRQAASPGWRRCPGTAVLARTTTSWCSSAREPRSSTLARIPTTRRRSDSSAASSSENRSATGPCSNGVRNSWRSRSAASSRSPPSSPASR